VGEFEVAISGGIWVAIRAIIEDEKLEHFGAALEQVANCYTASNVNAVLLVQNTSEESQSAFSINADQQQAAKMISFMAEAMKHIDDSNSRGQLN
jgi:hypothetical protein